MGASNYVTKPFSLEELLGRIRAVLKSSVSVSCLPCRSFRSMTSRRPAPRLRRALSPRSPKHQCINALAAAATCASSRPSCAGNSRNTNPRQFRQRSGSTPHDDGTDARHMQVRSMSVLASSRQRYPLRRYVNVAVRRNPKAQDCVTKTIRDPFTTQFTPVPRGKIAYLAASFRHIDACARGEIAIVAAPPPFPTRDFLPWRFSAAGRRSAWRDRHPGSRKPTQEATCGAICT